MWGKRKSSHEEELPAGGAAPLPTQGALAIGDKPSPQSAAASEERPTPNGAEPGATNGVDAAEAEARTAPNRAGQGPTADEIKFALTFTRIVSVLTRSPHYKHYTLSDLEWLVVPAILSGQCAVMEAKLHGRQVPVAVALWASVSEEVDKRLSGNLAVPIKLRPDEWRSGENLWLINAVGDPKAVPLLLQQIGETTFKGSSVKMRTVRPGGQPTVTSSQTAS
jgi:hemolysin-activating ACP:hemolysin acyltransferase